MQGENRGWEFCFWIAVVLNRDVLVFPQLHPVIKKPLINLEKTTRSYSSSSFSAFPKILGKNKKSSNYAEIGETEIRNPLYFKYNSKFDALVNSNESCKNSVIGSGESRNVKEGDNTHCVKSVRIRSYSGLHFLAFGMNTERYGVSLRIQSRKCGPE